MSVFGYGTRLSSIPINVVGLDSYIGGCRICGLVGQLFVIFHSLVCTVCFVSELFMKVQGFVNICIVIFFYFCALQLDL